MEIGIMKARPPHIKFVMRPVEDRNASIEAGYPISNDVPHVIITAQGSRDSVEKPVAEWLAATDAQVQENRVPADWAEKFHQAFAHWKRGEEVPVEGLPLGNWPMITPSELLACKAVHILSLEELAVASDEGVRRLGMGGIALKQRAIRYLAEAGGSGRLMAENLALREQVAASETRREALEERVKALEAAHGAKAGVQVIKPKVGIDERL